MFKEYETKINSLVDKIKLAQSGFFKDNKRYFQLLSDETKPSDEKLVLPTIDLKEKTPLNIEVHTYQLHDDWGYSIILTAEVDGKIYKKSIGEGIGHTFDWKEIEKYGSDR